MSRIVKGSLHSASAAPGEGETTAELVHSGGVAIEQILSGELAAPVDYCQEDDEWALVIEGSATLEVEGESIELGAGDWILLPAGVPHRLVRTSPGTSWLTVRWS
jgi:mannose-6-phosphate isomerase-like protein (cupin superfamily)